MSRPALSDKAKAAGITVERVKVGEAYPRNGNLHNPTPRYVWNARRADGRIVATGGRRGYVIETANDYAEDPR